MAPLPLGVRSEFNDIVTVMTKLWLILGWSIYEVSQVFWANSTIESFIYEDQAFRLHGGLHLMLRRIPDPGGPPIRIRSACDCPLCERCNRRPATPQLYPMGNLSLLKHTADAFFPIPAVIGSSNFTQPSRIEDNAVISSIQFDSLGCDSHGRTMQPPAKKRRTDTESTTFPLQSPTVHRFQRQRRHKGKGASDMSHNHCLPSHRSSAPPCKHAQIDVCCWSHESYYDDYIPDLRSK
jgi:hypothetical protein